MIIRNVQPATQEELSSGEFIAILHAVRTPPHIGMIIEGVFYDISVRGKLIEPNLGGLLRNIHRRRLESLFIKIDSTPDKDRFIQIMDSMEGVSETTTCLAPIKQYYGVHDASFVFELLPQLAIQGGYQLNMEEVMDGTDFTLNRYTAEELSAYIAKRKAEENA